MKKKRKFKFIVVSAVIASLAAAVVSVSANEAFEIGRASCRERV